MSSILVLALSDLVCASADSLSLWVREDLLSISVHHITPSVSALPVSRAFKRRVAALVGRLSLLSDSGRIYCLQAGCP